MKNKIYIFVYMGRIEKFSEFDKFDEGFGDKMRNIRSSVVEKTVKIKNLKWDDVKSYGSKIWNSVKRESSETKQAVGILQRMIDGEDVSKSEKKFLKEQSKDLIKIISTGVLPIPITAILAALGKKYRFDIFPGDQEELKRLIEKEKEDIKVTIKSDEK